MSDAGIANDFEYLHPVVSSGDFALIEKFASEFEYEAAEVFYRASLNGILHEAYGGNPEALVAWQAIAAEIRRRASSLEVCARNIDALGMDFWQNHSVGAQFRKYRQHKGS